MEGRAMMGWMLVFAILVLLAPTSQLVEGSRITTNNPCDCASDQCEKACQWYNCVTGRCNFGKAGIHCLCVGCN